MNKFIVLIRHGESLGNKENKFTGWLDVNLTSKGYMQAYKAGLRLRKSGFIFNLCYTSFLKRAIKTTWSVLDGMNNINLKTIKTKYLNERHYGSISGLTKNYSSNIYGSKEVDSWLNILSPEFPPKYDKNDVRYRYSKVKYRVLSKLTSTESLRGVFNRLIKFWRINILPKLKLNKKILLISHSNILKILISYLLKDYNTPKDILPNNTPMVIELNRNFKALDYKLL